MPLPKVCICMFIVCIFVYSIPVGFHMEQGHSAGLLLGRPHTDTGYCPLLLLNGWLELTDLWKEERKH